MAEYNENGEPAHKKVKITKDKLLSGNRKIILERPSLTITSSELAVMDVKKILCLTVRK